jgi:hypothetical protein
MKMNELLDLFNPHRELFATVMQLIALPEDNSVYSSEFTKDYLAIKLLLIIVNIPACMGDRFSDELITL